MNCSVSVSISKVTMSYQICDHFSRDPTLETSRQDHRQDCHSTSFCRSGWTLQKGNSSDSIVLVALTHEFPLCLVLLRVVLQRLQNSQSHRFRESYLGHATIHPRGDLGLWMWQSRSLIVSWCWRYLWSTQHMTLTWRTGPILECPPIHPIGPESWWPRGNMYSLHDPVVPPNPSSTSWVFFLVLSDGDFPHESSRLTDLRCFNLTS